MNPRSRLFSLFLGFVYVGTAFGPLLGSFLVHLTDSVLTIFYVSVSVHLTSTLLSWFIIPESVLRSQMQASRETHAAEVATLQQRDYSALSRIGHLVFFLRPLLVFAPTRVEHATTPHKAGKRDWALTLVAVAYFLDNLCNVCRRLLHMKPFSETGLSMFRVVSHTGCSTPLRNSGGRQSRYVHMLSYALIILTLSAARILDFYIHNLKGYSSLFHSPGYVDARFWVRHLFIDLSTAVIEFFKSRRQPAIQLPMPPLEPLEADPSPTSELSSSPASTVAISAPGVDLRLARVSLVLLATTFVLLALAPSGGAFTGASIFGSLASGFIPTMNSVALELYTHRGGTESGKLFGALSVVQSLGYASPLSFRCLTAFSCTFSHSSEPKSRVRSFLAPSTSRLSQRCHRPSSSRRLALSWSRLLY